MMRWFPVFTASVLAWVYLGFLRRAWADQAPDGPRPGQALLSTFSAWTALPMFAGLGVTMMRGGLALGVVGFLIVLAAIALLVPWPLATVVAIPRGWPRAAYALTRLSTLRSHPDPVGVAMAASARALLRSHEPDAELAGWIEAHGHGRSITPGMVLAHGLLAARRGDDALARRLLATVERFDARAHDDIVLRWSREWRAAEAAERGAWSEVVEAASRLGPTSQVTRWLEGVGRRYAGVADAPGDETLDARWQQIPRRSVLSDLHHACLGHRGPTASAPADTEEAPSPLQRHVDAVAHPTPTTLAAALAAWARVADAQRDRLPRAIADLAAAAAEAGVRLPPLPAVLQAHATGSDADDAVLRPLELASQRLTQRLMAPTPVEPLAALFDWMDLEGLLDDVRRQGSPGAMRLAFRPAYGPLTALSVTLYNDLGEHQLSNALTRWLLALAREVGDERAIEHQTRNLAATAQA